MRDLFELLAGPLDFLSFRGQGNEGYRVVDTFPDGTSGAVAIKSPTMLITLHHHHGNQYALIGPVGYPQKFSGFPQLNIRFNLENYRRTFAGEKNLSVGLPSEALEFFRSHIEEIEAAVLPENWAETRQRLDVAQEWLNTENMGRSKIRES